MSGIKSFSTETAERYALALFELSNEVNNLDLIENNVKDLIELYEKNKDLKNFFKNPTNSAFEQHEVIKALCLKLGFSKNFQNFLLLLVSKRRIFFIDKILKTFLLFLAKDKGEISASLISSKELSNEEIEKISKNLSAKGKAAMKFDYKVDKSLIGGFKIQVGSLLIDTSIKNKLKKINQLMTEK